MFKKFEARRLISCFAIGLGVCFYALLLGYGAFECLQFCSVTMVGMYIWAVFGWSYDEVTKRWDRTKYFSWIQKIGTYFYPVENEYPNRMRGIIMKGLRNGVCSLPMFIGYSLILMSAWPLLPWLTFFLHGLLTNLYAPLQNKNIDPMPYIDCTLGIAIGSAIAWVI